MEMEIIVLIGSGFFLVKFLARWYEPLFTIWPPERNRMSKNILGWLPVVFSIVIFMVLKFLASFDVVDSLIYILFYIVLGYAWMYWGFLLLSRCFDLHWVDDVIYQNNKAALAAVIGEFFALAFIYAGANVGDGPGWWCVLFAGSLGLAAWIILGYIIHYCTGIFERITVDRNMGSSIRFCLYLLCSGAILGYACSGDWTSFSMTVVEFAVGWPVLPLTAAFIIIELFFRKKPKHEVFR